MNMIVSCPRIAVTLTMWVNVGKKFWMRIPCVATGTVVVKFCPFDKEKNRKNNIKHVHGVQD